MQLKLKRMLSPGDFDSETPLSKFDGVRFTVREASVRRLGEYAERSREAKDAFFKFCDTTEEEAKATKKKDFTEHQLMVRGALFAWAKAVAVTSMVEVCEMKSGEEVWRESSLREVGLDVAEGALDVPGSLLDSWAGAAGEVNASIDGIAETAEQKKSKLTSIS